jgi:hypothetical protein
MQTAIFGNTITVGSSRFSRPEKWMMISEPNCVWLFDEHDLQDVTHSQFGQQCIDCIKVGWRTI